MAAKKETVITTVKMTDGSVVEFAGKRKMLKESSITPEGQVQVRLNFLSGEFRVFTVPADLVSKFAAHGAEQKLGDELAGLKGANGGEADIDDCVLAIDDLINRLYEGQWSVKRASNGLAGTSVLIRALVESTGKSIEQIRAFLTGKTMADKLALRGNPKIKPIIDRMEAEKASSKPSVDTDAMLDELA